MLLVVNHQDIARLLDGAEHWHFLSLMKELDIVDAKVKQSAKLVTVAFICAAVVKF